jgi:hypothetical protein
MTENEKFLYVTQCRGTEQNLKEPVNVSVALDVGRVGISIGCPFAKEIFDKNKLTTRCVAPLIERVVTEKKAATLPICYHLIRKSSSI